MTQTAVARKSAALGLLWVTPLGFLCKRYSGPAHRWLNNYGAGLLYEVLMNKNYDQILSALQRSSFRARFGLGKRDRLYIQKKGMSTIREHAVDLIRSRIAPAFPKNDGKQTPMRNHPVFIAQHATGTCCRKCLQKWHGIEKGRVLTDSEVDFVVTLIMRWIERNAGEGGHPA